ncbi:MAG: PilN domain-containing protein [Solirubrobacterales bacterium]
MRPVNLIPPDERRGDSAPLRTGSMIYVLVAGLALLLLGVVAVALTSKQIKDRESDKASLSQELDRQTARANSLAAFAGFRTVQEQRTATVSSLAQSRFDWQRVLQELSLVLPSDVHLTNLTGTVSPQVTVDGGGDVTLRGSIAGPALEITGCAPGQDSVAGFVSDLEDIDGVTRVGLNSSTASSAEGGSSSASGGDVPCVAGPKPYDFEIVVAFDAVPTPSTATTAPSVPPSVPPSPGSGSGSDASQVTDGQSEEAVARASTGVQTSKAQKAKSTLLPGG